MKKFKGFIFSLLLLLPMLSLFSLTSQADTQSEMIDLVLHKRIIRDINEKDVIYQNNGLKLAEDFDIVTGPTPLNGAEFSVYDMTDFFYEEIAKHSAETVIKEYSTRSNAQKLIQSGEIQEVANVITSGEGDSQGTARIPISRLKNDNFAVYLIFENRVENDAIEFNINFEKIAMPIIVTLPIMNPINYAEELKEIHIYPKNIGYIRDPYFFKYGKENSESNDLGVPLEGAIFVLYRIIDGQKYYLDLSPVSNLQNNWVPLEDTNPLTDLRISRFISDENGLVTTGGRLLPSGEYFFEEVQSVKGYQIEEKSIPVVIPDTWEDENGNPLYVKVNGQQMEELENGEVPALAYEKAQPRVYNYQVPEQSEAVLEGSPITQTSAEPSRSKRLFLPKTGEEKTLISLLGIVIVLIATVVECRRKALLKSQSKEE